MDSALGSLASDRVSNFSFKSAHTQNTATERINAMITENVNARETKFYDLSENDMEPLHELDTSSPSSSDGQNYTRNHIPIDDYLNSIRDLKNESMLREMEAERRSQEITENNTGMFRESLFRIHGETAVHNMQQQDIIDYYVNQFVHVPPPLPPPYSFRDKKPKPLFPQDPVLQQHLRAVEMSQQSRQAPTSASNNDPEPSHEPKGSAGRPRNTHGVPTETRKDPFYWQSQPTEFIRTQLSNRGWRTPHVQHLTQKRTIAKRLTREHYLKELFHLLGDIDY